MRSRDILSLRWNQIDFENCIIKDAYRTQKSKTRGKIFNLELTRHDLFIDCEHVIKNLKRWYGKTEDKIMIFPDCIYHIKISNPLKVLLNDDKFYTHQLRGIGMAKRLYELNKGELNYEKSV
jgi:integrase